MFVDFVHLVHTQKPTEAMLCSIRLFIVWTWNLHILCFMLFLVILYHFILFSPHQIYKHIQVRRKKYNVAIIKKNSEILYLQRVDVLNAHFILAPEYLDRI